MKKGGNILRSVFWLCNTHTHTWNRICSLDYVRSKEKNWKRKEMKKSIMTENEKLV